MSLRTFINRYNTAAILSKIRAKLMIRFQFFFPIFYLRIRSGGNPAKSKPRRRRGASRIFHLSSYAAPTGVEPVLRG